MPLPRRLVPLALFLLLATSFLSLSAGIDLWEEIKNGVNKLETDRQRIIWDDEGIRVEEKPWYEKAWASLNKSIFGDENRRRRKRLKDVDSKGNKEEIDQKAWPKPAGEEEEVVDTANAKIVLFRNGTRLVDVDGGPLVTVNPDGGMVVDYRNGTVKRVNGTRKGQTEEGKGGRRSKRFNSIDDLYLFHGWRSSGRDPEEFGKDGFKEADWDRFLQPKGRSSDDEETEEEEEEEGSPKIGPKHWGWKEEDAYWNRPLYGHQQNGAEGEEGTKPVKSIIGGGVVNGETGDDALPTGIAQGQHGPSSLITAHHQQPPSSMSSSPQNWPHPSAGTVNQSPPLTPEELEKIRVLFHRHQQNGVIQQSNVVDQTANDTRHGIGANEFGENGANSEKKGKGQQNPAENIQNIQDQDNEPRQMQQHQSLAKPPKWAKPK